MALLSSILDRVPEYVPSGTISVSESYEFAETSGGSTKTVYQLNKSPFDRITSVEAPVDGITTDLSVGSDVETRDTDATAGDDSIAFVNTDKTPDVGSEFTVEYRVDPVIYRYILAFDDDIASVGADIDESISSKYIDTAPGDSLDRIGSAFGEIGRRRRRSNSEYRSFLRSIVRAFNANGTIEDVKFAVASALRGNPSDVRIEEDFDQRGFRVYVDVTDSEVLTTSLNDLIQLSSPTGVELLRAPVIQTEASTVTVVAGESTVVAREDGVGANSLSSGDTLE